MSEGFARAQKTSEGFEVVWPASVVIDEDVERAAYRVRPMPALYVGGMGAKNANVHYEVLARLGWESVCGQIQDLHLDGRKAEAAAAIPVEMVSDVALIGPVERIRDQLEKWDESVVTTLAIFGPPQVLETWPPSSEAAPWEGLERRRPAAPMKADRVAPAVAQEVARS